MHRLEDLSLRLSVEAVRNNESMRNKDDWFKHNGWGYKDTEFKLNEDGTVHITGSRYQFAGQKMPKFKQWVNTVLGIDENNVSEAQRDIPIDKPIPNQPFLDAIQGKVDEVSVSNLARLNHSHGHSLQQLFLLRNSRFLRTVDYVVFIANHQQAEIVIAAAKQHNVVLIPFGGGTNVTEALMCNPNEKRTIVSVDVTRMSKIKWVDKNSMMACVEAGIVGKDLERELSKFAVCCGHEPDSVQFSTLGGWVSTRASGMKKNKYGNIDDIVIGLKVATPIGTLEKLQNSPRISSGPDVHQFILGHEGNFGIITECVIKVRPLPEVRVYESILFYDFELGIKFMYEVAQSKAWPASLRLMDNKQFQFGMALKTEQKSQFHEFINKAKKYFVTQLMKFDPDKMCLSTILFEGRPDEVAAQQRIVFAIAKKYQGFQAGAENGERGYFLTFMIAYLRDFGFRFCFIAESFETSLPWKNVSKMCSAVSKRLTEDCKKHGIQKEPFISFRVTQIYDTGAVVYIYFGFVFLGLPNPLLAYTEIEDGAREEIMKYGGSISHHHGVGKLRKKFLPKSIGATGVSMLEGLKKTIDPQNIFATGNLIDSSKSD